MIQDQEFHSIELIDLLPEIIQRIILSMDSLSDISRFLVSCKFIYQIYSVTIEPSQVLSYLDLSKILLSTDLVIAKHPEIISNFDLVDTTIVMTRFTRGRYMIYFDKLNRYRSLEYIAMLKYISNVYNEFARSNDIDSVTFCRDFGEEVYDGRIYQIFNSNILYLPSILILLGDFYVNNGTLENYLKFYQRKTNHAEILERKKIIESFINRKKRIE